MDTALIVEDDPFQREIIHLALGNTFLLLEADSAAQALAICEHYPADITILICDLSLPGMNAEQLIPLATKLRPALKVLVISGCGEQYLRDGGIADAHSVLTKPFQVEQIQQKARSLATVTSRGSEIMNILSPTPPVSRPSEPEPSIKKKVQQQLNWINSELEKSSGSERRALEKAREELSRLIRIVDDI